MRHTGATEMIYRGSYPPLWHMRTQNEFDYGVLQQHTLTIDIARCRWECIAPSAHHSLACRMLRVRTRNSTASKIRLYCGMQVNVHIQHPYVKLVCCAACCASIYHHKCTLSSEIQPLHLRHCQITSQSSAFTQSIPQITHQSKNRPSWYATDPHAKGSSRGSCSLATFLPVQRQEMHITLPVPEQDPQDSVAASDAAREAALAFEDCLDLEARLGCGCEDSRDMADASTAEGLVDPRPPQVPHAT